jgi:hypothetical protein
VNQSNALNRLKTVISNTINSERKRVPWGYVILEAMEIPEEPKNIIDFYALLQEAYVEGKNLDEPDINLSDVIKNLHSELLKHPPFQVTLEQVPAFSNNDIIVTTLHLMGFKQSQINPKIALGKDFLEQLHQEFKSLLNQIDNSDLDKELKDFLTLKIKEILQAIDRYHITGTEGIEKVIKIELIDLTIKESNLTKEQRKNPILKKWENILISTLVFFQPSVYDVIGLGSDVIQIQEFLDTRQSVEKIIAEEKLDDFEKIIQRALKEIPKKESLKITGKKEPLALPPSQNDEVPKN